MHALMKKNEEFLDKRHEAGDDDAHLWRRQPWCALAQNRDKWCANEKLFIHRTVKTIGHHQHTAVKKDLDERIPTIIDHFQHNAIDEDMIAELSGMDIEDGCDDPPQRQHACYNAKFAVVPTEFHRSALEPEGRF